MLPQKVSQCCTHSLKETPFTVTARPQHQTRNSTRGFPLFQDQMHKEALECRGLRKAGRLMAKQPLPATKPTPRGPRKSGTRGLEVGGTGRGGGGSCWSHSVPAGSGTQLGPELSPGPSCLSY